MNSTPVSRSLAITAIIVFAVVAFILGGWAGMSLSGPKTAGSAKTPGQAAVVPSGVATQLANTMKSKLLNSVILVGKVASISGNNILLINNGDSAEISVANDAKIFLIDYSQKGPAARSQATLKDIKVGYTVSVSAKVSSNYQIQATSLIMYSSPAPTK